MLDFLIDMPHLSLQFEKCNSCVWRSHKIKHRVPVRQCATQEEHAYPTECTVRYFLGLLRSTSVREIFQCRLLHNGSFRHLQHPTEILPPRKHDNKRWSQKVTMWTAVAWFYCTLPVIELNKQRSAQHMSHMTKKCTEDFGLKIWRKRPLGKPRRRWKNIQMDHKERGLKGVEWMNVAQERNKDKQALGNMVMNIRVPEMQSFLTRW
jgi:hypothetical protein